MIRKLMLFFMVVILFVLQSTLGMVFPNLPATPNLLLILTCYVGFTSERVNGLFVGLIAGFFMDIFYCPYIGPYMLLFLCIGYVCGLFHDIFYAEDIMWPICLILIMDFVYNFLVYVFRFLLANKLNVVQYLCGTILPEMIITVLIGILFYWPILKFGQFFDVFEDRSIKNLD